jgi:hypothetical protein
VNTDGVAASRLPAVIGFRDYNIDIAEIRVRVGRINEAVRFVVLESMWGRSSRTWRSWSSRP